MQKYPHKCPKTKKCRGISFDTMKYHGFMPSTSTNILNRSFIPNRSLGLVVFRSFRRMNFVCLLMSDSELSRIKNKQKASYKNRKTTRSNLKNPHTA